MSVQNSAIPEKRHMGLKASRTLANTTIYVVLIVISVVWLIPFVCILLQSFRVESTYQVGYVMPQQWGLDNYKNLFQTDFPRWYVNTFIAALVTAVLQTVIVLCMSYTLSRFRFKMRKPLMSFMLILGMFPGMLSMIILYRVLSDLGLTQANAVPGLILVYVASSGMGYYVSKGFFDTIPKSLDEAARVDGATRAQVLWKIILPLAKPIVIYTILTAFMGPWGDFVFARYVSFGTSAGMNVAVGLYNPMNETKLLEGTSLDDITDFYPYQGKDYFAKDFLAIVIGGAVPNDDSEMVNLWNQLTNNHIIEVTGNYTYNGVTYTKAYEYLYARGLNMSTDNAYSFHEICSYAANLPDGYVLTYSDLVNISRYNGVDNLWEGMTKEDLIQEIDNKYKTDILNYVQTLGWQASGISDPDSYLPSSTDELITQIESKMDSLNSFSQQKMIELQSLTNKRDQSYDMISNILKSLNTTMVGNVNNM